MSTTALAAVVAKLTGLSLAGKAAVGLAAAVGAVGAAGGVTAIVDSSPGVVETEVVDAAEPIGTEVEVAADESAEESTDEESDGGDDGTDQVEKVLPEAAEFGQSVAADAREGGVIGADIAELARERAALRHSDDEPVDPVVEPTEAADEVETDVDADDAADDAPAGAAVHGKPAGAPGARP